MLTSKESAAAFAQETGMMSCVDIRDYQLDYNRLTRKGQILINNSRHLSDLQIALLTGQFGKK